MMNFFGVCVSCGVALEWTLDNDDQVWTRCPAGCQPEQLSLSLGSEWTEDKPKSGFWDPRSEPSGGRGVDTCEGGAAEEMVCTAGADGEQWPGDPPPGFLDTLWEGSWLEAEDERPTMSG